jgi:hypothetical protein
MRVSKSAFSFPETRQPGIDHRWIRALVTRIDERLRRRYGVSEFTRSRQCIFRMQVVSAGDNLLLNDGTRLRPRSRIINLHLWNEQVPHMPAGGPTLVWARRMSRGIDVSLRELATLLAARRDLDGVVALRADMKFGLPEQSTQLARISGRYGFEHVPSREPQSLGEHLHRRGESILIAMLVLARNSAGFRMSRMWRSSTVVYLSRRELMRRYGPETSFN